MQPAPLSESDPKPLRGEILFEEGDFHALSEPLCREREYDDRRLVTRRKLLALGKKAVREAAGMGLGLECRTSSHNPNAFNGMRVRRIWTYLTRPRSEKRRLRGVLGAELARDLDAAFRNAYLCLAIEEDALEASLRIHPEAWYDGQNLKRRLEREGTGPWRNLLNELGAPWRLRLHDWKGEWRCGELTPERLEEYLSYYTPGDHRLALERRWRVPRGARGAALTPEAPLELGRELLRLLPAYRHAAWSEESDYLFGA